MYAVEDFLNCRNVCSFFYKYILTDIFYYPIVLIMTLFYFILCLLKKLVLMWYIYCIQYLCKNASYALIKMRDYK